MPKNLLNGATAIASFMGIGRGQRVRAEADEQARRLARRAAVDDLSGEDDAEGDPDENAQGTQDNIDDNVTDDDGAPMRRRGRKRAKGSADPAPADDDDAENQPDNPDDSQDDPNNSQDNTDDDDDDLDDGDEGGDDPDSEMRGRSAAAAARRRERARCAAILAHPAASLRADYAGHLAFNTRLSRREAIALLKAAPKAGGGLSGRMADYAGQRAGASNANPGTSPTTIASSWDAAFKRVKQA